MRSTGLTMAVNVPMVVLRNGFVLALLKPFAHGFKISRLRILSVLSTLLILSPNKHLSA